MDWNPDIVTVTQVLTANLSNAHHVGVASLREIHTEAGDMMKSED
jgi:hypothetical protein